MGQEHFLKQIGRMTETAGSFQKMMGLAALFSACLLSGFAGVFFERLLKDSAQPSVVVR